MKKAICYARSAVASPEKMESQVKAMRQFAAEHGYQVVCEVQEVASGANLERPELKNVRQMLARGEANVLIVCSTDRLARNLSHLMILQDELKAAGITICYVTGDDDTVS